jgi:IS30 family transposase
MKHLDFTERNLIKDRLDRWISKREIARRLWRHHSTIDDEHHKNTKRWKEYCPEKAQHRAYVKAHMKRKSTLKVRLVMWLEEYISEHIKELRCPKTIAKRRSKEHPWYSISTPSIYAYLNSRYWKHLQQYTRSQRTKLRKRKAWRKRMKSIIPFKTSIHDRPVIISFRAVIWHYECDLIMWTKNNKTCILTLVEMKTRYIIAVKCNSKTPDEIYQKLKEIVKDYHIKSITFDNWIEFMKHNKLWIPTYFCDPYCSREKPQVERINRDIRKFKPKKSNLDLVTQDELDKIIIILNNTPNGVLWYYTPQEVRNHLCNF